MAKKKRQQPRCANCGTVRSDWETFFRNLCETCRDKQAAKRRRRTATRVLAKAEDAGNGRARRRDLHRARATAETEAEAHPLGVCLHECQQLGRLTRVVLSAK
jgi:hypothetical protein